MPLLLSMQITIAPNNKLDCPSAEKESLCKAQGKSEKVNNNEITKMMVQKPCFMTLSHDFFQYSTINCLLSAIHDEVIFFIKYSLKSLVILAM